MRARDLEREIESERGGRFRLLPLSYPLLPRGKEGNMSSRKGECTTAPHSALLPHYCGYVVQNVAEVTRVESQTARAKRGLMTRAGQLQSMMMMMCVCVCVCSLSPTAFPGLGLVHARG